MKKNNSVPLIVITPTYNQANFIQQTIQSVVKQKYSNLKYWIIDGKSSDDTRKIVNPFLTELKFVSENDAGQADAINKGFRLALKKMTKAEIESGVCAYINSDDFYLEGAFEKVMRAFNAHPEKTWLVGDAKIVDGQNNEIQGGVRTYKKLWRTVFSHFILTVLNPLPQPAVFMRMSAMKKIGEFDTKLHYTMDYEYWLRLYQTYGKPLILSEPLAAFRIHAAAKGSTGFTKQFEEEYQVARKYTQNSLALLLHTLHNQLIFLVYKLIK